MAKGIYSAGEAAYAKEPGSGKAEAKGQQEDPVPPVVQHVPQVLHARCDPQRHGHRSCRLRKVPVRREPPWRTGAREPVDGHPDAQRVLLPDSLLAVHPWPEKRRFTKPTLSVSGHMIS